MSSELTQTDLVNHFLLWETVSWMNKRRYVVWAKDDVRQVAGKKAWAELGIVSDEVKYRFYSCLTSSASTVWLWGLYLYQKKAAVLQLIACGYNVMKERRQKSLLQLINVITTTWLKGHMFLGEWMSKIRACSVKKKSLNGLNSEPHRDTQLLTLKA